MLVDVKKICSACNGKLLVNNSDGSNCIGNAVIDSRQVKENDIFVAIKGENVDGHNFIPVVINVGASLIVAEKDLESDVVDKVRDSRTSLIKVDSSQTAIQNIASFWRDEINSKVIAITGSVGKTTTKNITNALLSCKYQTTCNDGNLNNELGLPITVCKSAKNDNFLITEMGMSGFGEIEDLCNIAKPNWGLITNIGLAHLEYLGSQENIAKAKSELAIAINDCSGKMFLWADDKYLDFIIDYSKLKQRNVEIVYFGSTEYKPNLDGSQVWFENEEIDDNAEYTFDLCVRGFGNSNEIRRRAHLNFKGKHNIINACGAVAIAISAGISIDDIVIKLNSLVSDAGRQEMLNSKRGFKIINDSYNANPASVIASIDMFSEMHVEGKKIAVLGDMLELGNIEIEGHKNVGASVAKSNINTLICVGDRSKNMQQAALDFGMNSSNVFWFDNLEDAKNTLLNVVEPKDVVLFKASNSMKFSNLISDLVS